MIEGERMKYRPTVKANNRWETVTTGGHNGGIHDQEAFKSGVLMLEAAIAEWSSPILIHTILTGATALQYDSFIKRVKRDLDQAGIKFKYKGCTETASDRGGLHQHFMWVIDADDSRNSPFDDGNDTSAISRAATATQRTAPEFKVTVAQPRRHDTPYIALTPYTLQDAACWLSYLFKSRSKPTCHAYMSSRAARRTCH
jgi:hypothetical protein